MDWIETAEQRPKVRQTVIGFWGDWDIYPVQITKVVRYDGSLAGWHDDGLASVAAPTHWMPLPEPPK